MISLKSPTLHKSLKLNIGGRNVASTAFMLQGSDSAEAAKVKSPPSSVGL